MKIFVLFEKSFPKITMELGKFQYNLGIHEDVSKEIIILEKTMSPRGSILIITWYLIMIIVLYHSH